jgi:hypothetical protein
MERVICLILLYVLEKKHDLLFLLVMLEQHNQKNILFVLEVQVVLFQEYDIISNGEEINLLQDLD